MPENTECSSYIALNNLDTMSTAHVIGIDSHTGAAEQWWNAVDELTSNNKEPFGFDAQVGTARRVMDPIDALNLIDRCCYFLRPDTCDGTGQGEEPEDRLPGVTYTDGQPDVHVLVTLPVFTGALGVHTDTIFQLLRVTGTAEFAFAPNTAPGMDVLPCDCLHLSVSYADRRRPRTLTLCVGNVNDPATVNAAGGFAHRSMSEHLLFLPEGADFLRDLLRD